jgi:hypothetical protein
MLVHPTPFHHPSEAEKLHGIGKGLALKLEKRMVAHCKANGIPVPERVKCKRLFYAYFDAKFKCSNMN